MTMSIDQTATRPTSVSRPTTMRRTVRSELVKLRAVRSSVWLLGVAAGFTAVLGPIQSLGQVLAPAPAPVDVGARDAVGLALTGASTASLLLGVLGVLVVTGEYTTHAIRTTFTLVPQRRSVVLAKAVALSVATAATNIAAVAIAMTVSFAVLSGSAAYATVGLNWWNPYVLQLAAAMVWYLVGWSVLGLVAGWLTRSKIGGVGLLVGVMYVLPPLLGLLPERLGQLLIGLMPSSAGGAMITVGSATGAGSPSVGFALWTAYLVLFTVLAGWIVSRRDA